MNFAELLDIAAFRSRGGEAVSCVVDSLDYSELRARALRVAGLVRGLDLSRDSKVAIVMHNALEFPEIAFGVMGAGAVLLPVNPRLAPPELKFVLEDADVEAVFVDAALAPVVESLRPELPRIRHLYIVGGGEEASYSDAVSSVQPLSQWVERAADEDCLVVYTSGTTGLPKGALKSHGAAMWGASNFTTALGDYRPGVDRFLYAIPLASIGLVNIFGTCIFAGVGVELMPRFEPAAALRLVESRKVSSAYFVPTMWRILLDCGEMADADVSALKVGIWGGEPMAEALRQRIIDRFGPILVGVFGMTEGGMTSSRPGDDVCYPRQSGRAAGYNMFKVVDDAGQEVPRGQAGELVNRGPAVFSGYHKRPKETAEVLREGWYHTGDIGFMNEEGFIFIIDRKREMLISGGQNVYPAEIERALMLHPAVTAAAVVGRPDAQWGEVAIAFLVLSNPIPMTELEEFTRGRLAGYKVPKHWRVVKELPINANGKVRKHLLRELVASEVRSAPSASSSGGERVQ
jgi:fatty-acyl-CoA synthase